MMSMRQIEDGKFRWTERAENPRCYCANYILRMIGLVVGLYTTTDEAGGHLRGLTRSQPLEPI